MLRRLPLPTVFSSALAVAPFTTLLENRVGAGPAAACNSAVACRAWHIVATRFAGSAGDAYVAIQQQNKHQPHASALSGNGSAAPAPRAFDPMSSLRKTRVKARAQTPADLASVQRKASEHVDRSCSATAPAEVRPLTALQRRQLAMKDKVVFFLTPTAVYRIRVLMDRHNATARAHGGPLAVGVRVGVQKRGCSGYSYTVNYALETDLERFLQRKAELEQKHNGVIPIDALDTHVEQGGVHAMVDAGALFYVIGTKMDYSVSDVEEKFEFSNPNQKSKCGCGDSFQPEE